MKKGMAFIAVIIFLLALNYEKLFSLFEKNDVNVLAKVNGEEITLEEVEILYDMRNVHLNTPAPDVDRVQQEYAEILYNRIKQVLVSQELEKRNVAVTDEEVLLLENKVRESYLGVLDENQTFEEYLKENGINYHEWLKQIKSQLESDKLHALLMKEIPLGSEETLRYAEKIKQEQKKDFVKIQFFLLKANQELLNEIQHDTAFSRENVEKNGFSDLAFIEHFEGKGAQVFQSLFDSDSLPEQYKTVLVSMEPNTFSRILHEDGSCYVLYLEDKQSLKEDDAVDLYLLAEERLLQEKLPQVFADWLSNAVKNSDIHLARSFDPNKLTKNVDINNLLKLQEVLTETEN